MTGRVIWWELRSTDVAASAAFYGELLGWEFAPLEPWGLLVQRGGASIGGLSQTAATGPDPTAMIVVQVDDLDATVERARQLGGTALRGPLEDGQGGRFVDVRDPSGCTVVLWSALPR